MKYGLNKPEDVEIMNLKSIEFKINFNFLISDITINIEDLDLKFVVCVLNIPLTQSVSQIIYLVLILCQNG